MAVKVLLFDLKTEGARRRRFESEANLMAQLSSHPCKVRKLQVALPPENRN